MDDLSERTHRIVERMFPSEQHAAVGELLAAQCGRNLPLLHDAAEATLDRIRCAVLKLADGDLDALQRAIALAQRDWRDVLMAASFGHSLTAHDLWADAYLAQGPSDED